MPSLRLKATHTHAGAIYPADHVLDVDPHTARWLLDHGIAVPVDSRPEPVASATTAPVRPTKPNTKE